MGSWLASWLARVETPLFPLLLCLLSIVSRPELPFQKAGSASARGASLQGSRWGCIPQRNSVGLVACWTRQGWGGTCRASSGVGPRVIKRGWRQSLGQLFLAWGYFVRRTDVSGLFEERVLDTCLLRLFFQLSGIQQRLACRVYLETPPSPSSAAFQTRKTFSPHKAALCQVWPQERKTGEPFRCDLRQNQLCPGEILWPCSQQPGPEATRQRRLCRHLGTWTPLVWSWTIWGLF